MFLDFGTAYRAEGTGRPVSVPGTAPCGLSAVSGNKSRWPACSLAVVAFPLRVLRAGGTAFRRPSGVGSEEARPSAGLRPPLKLHVRFSRMQLSRRRSPSPRGQGRNQADQAHQPQLAPESPCREGLPPRTAPPSIAMRPQASLHPSIELVEESPHVSALEVLAPSANHRIEFADQRRGLKWYATPRRPADPVLEPVDRLLRWIRIKTPPSHLRRDLSLDNSRMSEFP